jgi:ligand-binding sensor domain-containing protein
VSSSGKRFWCSALLLIALLFAVVAGAVYWRAMHALRGASQQVAAEQYIRFSVLPVEPGANPGFEWISAPAVFSGAARFQDKLYLSGPAGLFEYSARGALLTRYLAGQELPPSPLGVMAQATLADSRQPELLIATASEGVLAFNGRAFRQIRPEDAAARSVTTLLPMASGSLLIGTQKKGVLVYDGHEITRLHSTLANIHVTALAGDESELWVGTLDRGVLRFHAGQTDSFGEAEGMPDAQVHSIAMAEGSVYVGTSAGVAEFRDGKLRRVLARGALARALLPRAGGLLIGTMDEGIADVPLALARVIPVRLRASVDIDETEQLFDAEGAVFALTRDGLYELRHGAGWKRVLSRGGAQLTDRNVSALSVDHAGRLWVGYFDRGLDILAPSGGNAQHVENERAFCVNRIVPRPGGDGAYVATANGLLLFDNGGNEQQALQRSDGLIADHVTDVVPYRGGIAVATPAGLTFLDASGARSLYAFHGLVNNHVYALGVFGDRLVAGTLGGLTVLDDEKIVTSYTTATSGLKHNWITAVVPVGNEWMIGTYGAGIMSLDASGHFQPLEAATGKFEVNPNAMLATPKHVFAGTLGHGLYVYNRESRRWTAVHDGLPSESITALAVSGGYLYVGTDNGLVRIVEQHLP